MTKLNQVETKDIDIVFNAASMVVKSVIALVQCIQKLSNKSELSDNPVV